VINRRIETFLDTRVRLWTAERALWEHLQSRIALNDEPLATMTTADANDPTIKNTNTNELTFPTFPGENPLKHAITAFKESAETQLARALLLGVATNNDMSYEAQLIIDSPDLPDLDPSDRDYARRQEYHQNVLTMNFQNAMKRRQILFKAWAELYAACKECTATSAPLLSREIANACDMSKPTYSPDRSFIPFPPGTYDEPMASRMLLERLSDGAGERATHDKAYY
jgi:hypothetical protein